LTAAEKVAQKISQTRGVSGPLVGKVAQRIPPPVKRRLRRVLPQRYWRHFDPNWYHHVLGLPAEFERLGKLQLDYLVGQGLEPRHRLLDVGCGPLRAGVHFIRYLEPGHYFGIDRRADWLEIGREVEIPRNGLGDKRPVLVQMDDFGFERLGAKFDYALAQSVFTHLPANSILRCLMAIEKVLVPGGKFYATFYLNEQGKRNLDPIQQTARISSHFDRNPFHYDVAAFEWMCEDTSLTPEYLGDWGSPRNQKMLVFTKA
jgi:SAM-dependent methyltransferase